MSRSATQALQPVAKSPSAMHGILQRKCACGNHTVAGGECAECGQKREEALCKSSNQSLSNDVPSVVREGLNSPGQPLDSQTHAFMRTRFGRDFSRVRIHTDGNAAKSARAVNALAYTVGQDVAFTEGQYKPRTLEGRRLLAHELVHTVQQAHAGTEPSPSPDSRAEYEAKRIGDAVIGADTVPEIHFRGAPGLARQAATMNVRDLSDAQLGNEHERVRSWLTQHSVVEVDYGPTEDYFHAIEEEVGRRNLEARSSAQSAVPKSPLLPTVSSSDKEALVEVMGAVQSITPSNVASGLYTTVFHGKEIILTVAQRDALLSTARSAIRNNLQLATNKASSARSRYESQSEIDKQHYIVAPIVKLIGRIKDPGPYLLAEVSKTLASGTSAGALLDAGDLVQAASAMAEAEIAAIKAQKLWQAYFEGIIGASEMTVTVLEYTRDASFITLGALAIIATGGAAAAPAGAVGTTTTAFGLEVATASTANLIATGAPVVATIGGAGVQAALGDKVDWAKVGVDVAVSLILARFGGKLSHGIFKAMLGSPAVRTAGEVVVGRIVSSVLTHEGATVFTTAVDAVYRKFKGQNVTWDTFTDELIVRLTDPKGLIVASVMGAVVAGADVKMGGARGVQIEDKSGSKGELDVVRAGAIIEEKSATGIGTINPKTNLPFSKDTEVEWAARQIYSKTKVRLDNLKIVTATRTTPVEGGSRDIPSVSELQRVRKYEFSIKGDSPALRTEVEKQLQRLRKEYPDWTFSAKYGQ